MGGVCPRGRFYLTFSTLGGGLRHTPPDMGRSCRWVPAAGFLLLGSGRWAAETEDASRLARSRARVGGPGASGWPTASGARPAAAPAASAGASRWTRNACSVSRTLQAFSQRPACARTLPYVRQRCHRRQAWSKRCRHCAVYCRRCRNAAGVPEGRRSRPAASGMGDARPAAASGLRGRPENPRGFRLTLGSGMVPGREPMGRRPTDPGAGRPGCVTFSTAECGERQVETGFGQWKAIRIVQETTD